MSYPWLDEYLVAKKACIKDWKEEWAAFRYLLGDKMFAMWAEDNTGTPIITLKLAPMNGDALRQQYPEDIVPGYYMNKVHWNSVRIEGEVPDDILRDMIDESYELILSSLSKKKQAELLDGAV